MLALLQRLAQLRLHCRKHALGLTDLVAPKARDDDPLRVVRFLLKAHHRLRHVLHRPHDRKEQRSENQQRRHQRDHEPKRQNAHRIGHHIGSDRRFVDEHFNEVAAAQPWRTLHAQRPPIARKDAVQARPNQFGYLRGPQVDLYVDARRRASI